LTPERLAERLKSCNYVVLWIMDISCIKFFLKKIHKTKKEGQISEKLKIKRKKKGLKKKANKFRKK
jgi:hypothetical protein